MSNIYSNSLNIVDLEVFPNICIVGYLKDRNYVTYVVYQNSLFLANESNSLIEATNEDYLNFWRDLNSPSVAFNGYNYDFLLCSILRNWLYCNRKDILKQSYLHQKDRNIIPNKYFLSRSHDSITELIYRVSSKMIIEGRFFDDIPYYTDNPSQHWNFSDAARKIIEKIYDKTLYGSRHGTFKELQTDISNAIKSDDRNWDCSLCLGKNEPKNLKDYAITYLNTTYSLEYEFNFNAPLDMALLPLVIKYNKLDLDITRNLVESETFKGYRAVRTTLRQVIEKQIKKSRNRRYNIVLNSLSDSNITEQFGRSFVSNTEIVTYDTKRNLLNYTFGKVTPDLYNELHSRLTQSYIDDQFSILNKENLGGKTNTTNIIDFLKAYGTTTENVKAHDFVANLKTNENFLKNRDTSAELPNAYLKYIKIESGLGGLHSELIERYSDLPLKYLERSEDYFFTEFDVVSYYPFLIQKLRGMSDYLIECGTLDAFIKFMKLRVACKSFTKSGIKADCINEFENDYGLTLDKDNAPYLIKAFKLILNSVYGKLNDKYSIFFNPIHCYRVTLTGQYILTRIIQECMAYDFDDFRFIYGNTDGIMFRVKKQKFDHYKQLFDEISLRIAEEVFGPGAYIPFEEEIYEAIAYKNVNNIVKLRSFNEDHESIVDYIKDGSIVLKGVTYRLGKYYNKNFHNSYHSMVIALNHYSFNISIYDSLEKLTQPDLNLPGLALFHLKPSQATKHYIGIKLNDKGEEVSRTIIDRRNLIFYPTIDTSDESCFHRLKIEYFSGSEERLVDFPIKFVSNTTDPREVLKYQDFDTNQYMNLIEDSVDKLINYAGKNKDQVPRTADKDMDYDPTNEFDNMKLELNSLGFACLPAKNKKETFKSVKSRRHTIEWQTYLEQANTYWVQYRERKEFGCIKVALPDNIIAFDVDRPEDVDDRIMTLLKTSTLIVSTTTNSGRFKAFFKLPLNLTNNCVSLSLEILSKWFNGNKDAVEVASGYGHPGKLLAVYGYHTKVGKNKVKYVQDRKAQELSMLPDELRDILKFSTVVRSSGSTKYENLISFYRSTDLEIDEDNVYYKLFVDTIKKLPKPANEHHTTKVDIIWNLMDYGYNTGTLHYVIKAFRHCWSDYIDRLNNLIQYFDPEKRNGKTIYSGLNSICYKYKIDKSDFDVIRAVRTFEEPNDIDIKENNEIYNALLISCFQIVFPHNNLPLTYFNKVRLEAYEAKYNFIRDLTSFKNSKMIVSNLMLSFGFKPNDLELSVSNRYAISLEDLGSKPGLVVDDPSLERDIKPALDIDIRNEVSAIFDSPSDVSLVQAPTGVGKTYSTVLGACCMSIQSKLEDGSIFFVVNTHKETDTISSYFVDLFGDKDKPENERAVLRPGFNDAFNTKHPKTSKKSISPEVVKEYFKHVKVVPINKDMNNDVLDLLIEHAHKDKIFLFMGAYCASATIDGRSYSIYTKLMMSVVSPILTIIDEIHAACDSSLIEIPIDYIKINNQRSDSSESRLSIERNVTTFSKNGDSIDPGQTIPSLSRAFKRARTQEYLHNIELENESIRSFMDSLYDPDSFGDEDFMRPINSIDSDESDEDGSDEQPEIEGFRRYGAHRREMYTVHSFINKNYHDLTMDVEEEERTSDSSISLMINNRISRSPFIIFQQTFPIITESVDGETHLKSIRSFDEYKMLSPKERDNVNNRRFVNIEDNTTGFFCPLIKVYDTAYLTDIIGRSSKVIMMSATFKDDIKRLLNVVIAPEKSVDYYKCSRKVEDKLTEAMIAVTPVDLISSFGYNNDKYEPALHSFRKVVNNHPELKVLIMPPTKAKAQALRSRFLKTGIPNVLLDGNDDIQDKSKFSVEENDRIALTASRGSNGLGVNKPEYKMIMFSTDNWKPITSFGLSRNNDELDYAMHQDVLAICLQNAGRNTRKTKDEIEQDVESRRVFIIDGLSRILNLMGYDIDRVFNLKSIFESLIYYIYPQFNHEVFASQMITYRERALLKSKNKLLSEPEELVLCVQELFSQCAEFLDSGEYPDFHTYPRKLIIDKAVKTPINESQNQIILKFANDLENVKLKHNLSFDDFRKYHKFRKDNPEYANYRSAFISSLKVILEEEIQAISLSETCFVSLKTFLESKNVKSDIKKEFLEDQLLKDLYKERISKLVEEYLEQNPHITKREFRRKYSIDKLLK